MTDLTEQWKKGELPNGEYYIIDDLGLNTTDKYFKGTGFGIEKPQKILAKVPTYDEYQALLSDQLAKNEGVEVNAELKNSLYSMTQAWQIAEQQAKTLVQTLLKVSPEHREWLETNFKEYL